MTAHGTARVTVVVGNPRAGSRTLHAAQECAQQISVVIGTSDVESVDLAELGSGLLEWNHSSVTRVRDALRASTVLVVASPTYKATYTGLLKLLFDQIGADELLGTIAVPLMVGGAANHALAVDTHLRPLLIEVGCSCPTHGLYLLESDLENTSTVVTQWLSTWGDVLLRSVTPSRTEE